MAVDSNGTASIGNGQPKILVPEKVSPDGLALLRGSFLVDERKGLSADELRDIIGGYDALIVRSETKVTAALLQAGSRLKVVARAGVGVDNVDVPAATKRGIIVVNSPSGNIGAAAEHTIALMLAVARNIPDGCASLKAGKWERSRLVGVEMKGKTLGVIGLGKVGLNVARSAIGLGMRVQALDPYASPAIAQAAHVDMVSSLNDLLTSSDFLTIHTPLIASTKGMIGAAELGRMKKGARILNVARGGMIDEVALLESLEQGHLAGAGIDVFTAEPPQPGNSAAALIAHPKVVCTPHLGASTVEAQENVSIDVCEQVQAILRGELPRSAVNAPLILPEEYRTLQPFVRLVEKMGSLYTQHYVTSPQSSTGAPSPAAPRTTFDLIYEGKLATLSNTKPLFAALVKGLTEPVLDTSVNIVNADLVAADRGLIINEQHARSATSTYASQVILRARPAPSSRASSRQPASSASVSDSHAARPSASETAPGSSNSGTAAANAATVSSTASGESGPQTGRATQEEHVICGYVSGTQVYISRIDRFVAAFEPTGHLLILHNYDSPGKIGVVGGILGNAGVNINSMTVAAKSSLDDDQGVDSKSSSDVSASRAGHTDNNHYGNGSQASGGGKGSGGSEALMILGVDREVPADVLRGLAASEGILNVSLVRL